MLRVVSVTVSVSQYVSSYTRNCMCVDQKRPEFLPFVDLCLPNPCFHGSCFEQGDSYRCQCYPGYYGDNCEERDECHSNPCLHGNCTDGNEAYSCECEAGFLGNNCEDEDDCYHDNACVNNSTCVDGPGNYSCACRERFTGSYCEGKFQRSSFCIVELLPDDYPNRRF